MIAGGRLQLVLPVLDASLKVIDGRGDVVVGDRTDALLASQGLLQGILGLVGVLNSMHQHRC